MTESKCSCQHCGGHLAFPSEMDGQLTACPHCQRATVLLAPIATPQVRAVYSPAPSTLSNHLTKPRASAIPQSTLTACFVLSILIPIAGLAVGVWLITKNEVGYAAGCIVAAIVSTVVCFMILSVASSM